MVTDSSMSLRPTITRETIARTGMQVLVAEYRIVGREEIYLAGSEATRNAAEKALVTAQDSILGAAECW